SVRTAALANRMAVADALAQENGAILVACAGESGRFALEDALGAGALVAALLYRCVSERLADAIASADHAQTLAAKGFARDVTRCAALDTLDVVPTLRDGVIVARTPVPAR